jgi:hypothetical protein
MFKKLSMSLALIACLNSNAQEVSVEKSIFGIHTGFVGLWFNNEFRLSNKFTFRSEIGLELGAVDGGSSDNDDLIYLVAPVVSAEPRWYYNLEKRNTKGKNITKNSGNTVSLKINYFPDSFLITNYDNVNVVNQLSFIPKWGIRRVYGKHFTFETGFGVGPTIYFGKNADNVTNKQDVYVDIHLRAGYTF